MKPPEEVKQALIGQWVRMAEEDMAAAQALLDAGARFVRTACFHAQQAAEKFLKAYLVQRQIEFPKTHDIEDLLDLVATTDQDMAQSLRLASALNPYAVQARYPGVDYVLTEKDARDAVAIAGTVREAVLPKLGLA